eukprot:COSAG01_NODE_26354_length_716_cov_6.529984_1_plen_132_part_00
MERRFTTRSQYTYKGIRHVELDELDGFRIVKQLGSAAVPVVDLRPCTSDTGIFAAAVGLLRPARGSAKGLLGSESPSAISYQLKTGAFTRDYPCGHRECTDKLSGTKIHHPISDLDQLFLPRFRHLKIDVR